MASRIGRPRLQSERTDDAIVALITLRNDAGQRRHGGSAIGPQFHRYGRPPRRVESGERLSGEARGPVERLPHRATSRPNVAKMSAQIAGA